jgi:hypothetical protein
MSLRHLKFSHFALAVCAALGLAGCQQSSKPAAAPIARAATPSDDELCQKLDQALDFTYENRHLNTRDHAGWQVVHGILAFQQAYKIENNEGKLVPAIEYLMGGGRLKGFDLRLGDVLDPATGRRGVKALLDPGTKTGQGHADQWLGYMSQCAIPPEQKVMVEGQELTVRDWI